MGKILVVCGPTAVGKTGMGLELAGKFNGELISADSRQVYQGMDIGTGKDLPPEIKSQKSKVKSGERNLVYYDVEGVKLWGYDVVKPDEEWHAAAFVEMAGWLIDDIGKRGKLPIVVGGTGMYLKSLFDPPESISVPVDRKLRQSLEKLTVEQLQRWLRKLDLVRFNKMNRSDRMNRRRLVRAVEIAWSNEQKTKSKKQRAKGGGEVLWIGLRADLKEIDRRIEERVQKRLKQGVEEEVRKLVEKYGWNRVLLATIGYQECRLYLEKKASREEAIRVWVRHEKQYARRQLTWFKKQPEISWFDVTAKGYSRDVVALVRRWYDG